MKALTILKQFWHFLWNDDSLLSWIANIIVAFLLIKFIIYPGLGFVFGTNYPIVAVVSGSMEHDGSFDDWWQSEALCDNRFICEQREYYSRFSITDQDFREFDYPDGFNTGDIMILFGADTGEVDVGDIIVFRSSGGEPIIHRVINTSIVNGVHYYQTKGDHNTHSIHTTQLNELYVPHDKLLGRAELRVPYLGWVKILFFKMVSWIGGTLKTIVL